MANVLSYKDIEVGSEIPALTKYTTTTQLVKWAGATDEYYEIHYDKDFAINHGLPGVIAAGGMLWSFLSQMLTDWAGDGGAVRKLNCSFRGMHLPNESIVCKGKVAKKYSQGSQCYAECEVWAENFKGEKTIIGTAVLALPE